MNLEEYSLTGRDRNEERLHFWLREHGLVMEWYMLCRRGPAHYALCKCERLAESLRNLIDWFPLVWRDRDFDHYYLAQLLEFKLRRMGKHFHEHQITVGADAQARTCRIMADLIRRVEDDEYMTNQPFTRENFLAAEAARRRDLKLFASIFQRRFLSLWD